VGVSLSLSPLEITLSLASVTTVCLLIFATPLAWWLSQKRSAFRNAVNALVSLPLVLPPTVLGFYLLLSMGPEGPIGKLTRMLGLESLAFSFAGLVLGSVLYSLPFVIQPLQGAFESVGPRLPEAARTLGASPWEAFATIIFPMSRSGFFTASVLGFAHTVGEFGVVLMIGGNIPGRTKVLSVAVFDAVESMDMDQAHLLSGGLLLFSFLVLFGVYSQKQSLRISL